MWFDRLWRDVRHGLRLLAKSPGFTATAVLSIACGTGANIAMFSAADTLLLRPTPVRDARSLIPARLRRNQGAHPRWVNQCLLS